VAVKHCCGTADQDHEVEFREVIATAIPLFILRLENKDHGDQWVVAGLIANLASYGRHQSTSIVAKLTKSTKSSFVDL
jgi:hypothetical protein